MPNAQTGVLRVWMSRTREDRTAKIGAASLLLLLRGVGHACGPCNFGRFKTMGLRHFPRLLETATGVACEQRAGFGKVIDVCKRNDAIRGNPAHEMLGTQLPRVIETSSRDELAQCVDGLSVEVGDALGLIGHDHGTLARAILTCDAGRAFAGMALLRLNAPDGEHEAAGGVAPIGAKCQDA